MIEYKDILLEHIRKKRAELEALEAVLSDFVKEEKKVDNNDKH